MRYNLQFFGGRGSSANGSSGGSSANNGVNWGQLGGTNANGYLEVTSGNGNGDGVSKATILQAADNAMLTMTEPDTYKLGVSVDGNSKATATNYVITESVNIYGPDSVYSPTANKGTSKYIVRGDYYKETFNSMSAAQSAARAQLKKQLGKTYDLRTKNKG